VEANANNDCCILSSTLWNGEQLQPGDYLVSTNNQYALVFQSDSNICVYKGSTNSITSTNVNSLATTSGFTLVWNSGTAGLGGTNLVMSETGNLILYANQDMVWSAESTGSWGV
jgi:hypothetical protein